MKARDALIGDREPRASASDALPSANPDSLKVAARVTRFGNCCRLLAEGTPMKFSKGRRLCGLGVTLLASSLARAQDSSTSGPTTLPTTPATMPAAATTQPTTTQPVVVIEPAVQSLVDQLGDPSPAVRDKANQSLQAMGKTILPQLQAMGEIDDPELRGQVKELIRRFQRRMPPTAPKAAGGPNWVRSSTTIVNGLKTTDVNARGLQIHTEQRDGKSIKMTVTGVDENDREASETYEAKDIDELKKDDPEAYALYAKWCSGGIQLDAFGHRPAGMLRGQLVVPPAKPNAADQPQDDVRAQIERRIKESNLPADEQKKALDRLDEMQKHQDELLDHLKQWEDKQQNKTVPAPATQPAAPGDDAAPDRK
jgi:hypothetical protein